MTTKTIAFCLTLTGFFANIAANAQIAKPSGLSVSSQVAKKRFFRQQNASHPKPQASSQSDLSVLNAASYLPGVSPGGLATAFGSNLTDVSGVVVANSNPFPTTLANVSVLVNGIPAPIFSIAYANGEDQISFEVPWETDTGSGAAYIEVYDYGSLVGSLQVDSYLEDPGIFGYQKYGNLYAVALHTPDFSLVSPDDPAVRGEVLVLYTTGLGPVDQPVTDGWGAPYNPLANTLDQFQVTLAGEDVQVLFSGLAPGYVGLYQLNIRLPYDAPAGDLPLQITSSYANSQSILLSLQ